MTEPKTNDAELPEGDELPFDAPPAPAADPLFEDEAAPDAPQAPEPEFEPSAPEEPQDFADAEPVTDIAPLQVVEAVPAEPEPEAIEAAETELEPEPVAAAEPLEAAPEPEPELAPAPETVEALSEPEPDAPEELAVEAAHEAVDDPHPDIFGPEPWEQAPASSPPVRAGAWADVGPARDEPSPAPAPVQTVPAPAVARAAPNEATIEVKRTAFAIYFQYLSALMVIGVPLLPFACWLAYKRKEDAPEWLRSHYIYQIRTFWISMAGIGFAVLTAPLPFGLFSPTIVAVVVWLTIRCFFGLVRLHRGEPIFNPQTWIV